jgi:membrane protein implicated in regulation of membrane protease activity
VSFSHCFALVFIAGTVLGVFVMLIGVVRPSTGAIPEIPAGTGPFVSRDRLIAAAGRISARYNLPVLAAFSFAFGLLGYALSRLTQLGTILQLVIAGLAGGGLAVFAATLVARWALPAARNDIPDERYLLQGHLARVLQDVHAERGGLVSLEINGVHHTARAVSIVGEAIAAGTEVVIERIEGEVAFVEPWSTVEQRI